MPDMRCKPNSESGIPVSKAMGKKRIAVKIVSQLGMRKVSASLVAAKIKSNGNTETESVCSMVNPSFAERCNRTRVVFN